MEPVKYDGIIVITPADLERVRCILPRMRQYLPVDKLVFVGSEDVGEIVRGMPEIDAEFINENDIIPFDEVNRIILDILGIDSVHRGVTGWYYQQFLKMAYSRICKNDYYMVWDGDTVPCGEFSMFKADTNIPYLDVKHELCEEYFITMEKLFPGFCKVIRKSFVSEHMLFKCDIMQRLLADIDSNESLQGGTFYERILRSVRKDALCSNSFSEFETYGTYVAFKCPDAYMLRDWHSMRIGSIFFIPEKMTDDDFIWLNKDFNAISFEKKLSYIPEYAELFHNQEYRVNITPKDIVEALQDE